MRPSTSTTATKRNRMHSSFQTVFFLAASAYLIYTVAKGLSRGEVRTRSGSIVTRATSPFLYWIMLGFQSAAVGVFLVIALRRLLLDGI
jgi:hypothetical protein